MSITTTRLDRLKYILELSKMTRARFAKRLAIDPSNLSKYLTGKLPINDTLINRVALDMGVSRRWLRDGEGTPYEKELHARNVNAEGAEETVHRLLPNNATEGIPVYDIDVMAGTTPLSMMFTDDRVIGRMAMPQINPDSLIVRVTGDSMVPVVPDGAYINIRPVSADKVIFWGQMYVVILDDYRMVKFLRRHSDPAKAILHSANPDYDDIEIARSDIRGLYLVETVINFDVRC